MEELNLPKINNKIIYKSLLLRNSPPKFSENTILFHGSAGIFCKKIEHIFNSNFRNQIKSFCFLLECRCLPLSVKNLCIFCNKEMNQWHLFCDCNFFKDEIFNSKLPVEIVKFAIWKTYNKIIIY